MVNFFKGVNSEIKGNNTLTKLKPIENKHQLEFVFFKVMVRPVLIKQNNIHYAAAVGLSICHCVSQNIE